MTSRDDVADDSATAAAMRRVAFDALLREGARDLSLDELHRVIGPRFPRGDQRNRLRGARVRSLNARGFTFMRRKI